MKRLTDRQADILRWIIAYIEQEGYPPTIREFWPAFGISSLRGVTVHLDALHRKGYIKRQAYTSGAIRVLRTPEGKPVELRFVEVAA